ncbi:MAG: hypothetical protein IPP73_20000 [Chitinophagaceae bacterium]|nr:hypothetical protein [Chitinophagaceae bacterium]
MRLSMLRYVGTTTFTRTSSPVGCNPTLLRYSCFWYCRVLITVQVDSYIYRCPEVGSGCSFSLTRTWTVTDACGNIGTTTQTITFTRDTQAPVITVTPSTPVGCNPTAAAITAAFGTASVTDNCSTGLSTFMVSCFGAFRVAAAGRGQQSFTSTQGNRFPSTPLDVC